jgi:hypothetical protein
MSIYNGDVGPIVRIFRGIAKFAAIIVVGPVALPLLLLGNWNDIGQGANPSTIHPEFRMKSMEEPKWKR